MGAAPAAKPLPKHRPRFVLDAVKLLVSEASEGKVGLGALGQYLKRTNPAFTPNQYGHAGLLQMLKSYEQQLTETGAQWRLVGEPEDRHDRRLISPRSSSMTTALLVIDLQTTLCVGQWAVHGAQDLIGRVNAVSRKARAAGAPVVFIQHEDDHPLMRHGSEGWQLAPGWRRPRATCSCARRRPIRSSRRT
jgi:hypothetical protein